MKTKWMFRAWSGLLFAGPLMILSVALARAQATPVADVEDCQRCHPAFQVAWEQSAHGRATSDPAFITAWQAQDSPRECLSCHTTGYDPTTDTWAADGITCAACHGPFPKTHPQVPMPVDRSPNLCGTCHAETLFAWQVSQHRQNNLTCVSCHGPHSANLKGGDASGLCAGCHRARASNFTHTVHSQEGLNCADCHLGPVDGNGHAVRDHSFHVRLSTCNACHAYQMHDSNVVSQVTPTPPGPGLTLPVETLGLSDEPGPLNPVWFALVAGLIGMASGMVLAPWLERWYRRLNQGEE